MPRCAASYLSWREQSGSLPVVTMAPVARTALAVASACSASHPSCVSGSKIHGVSSVTREAKRRSPSSETSVHSWRTHRRSHTRHKYTTVRSTSITSRRVPDSRGSTTTTTTPGWRALRATGSGCRQRRRRQLGYPDRSHRRRADDKAKQKIRRRRARCRRRRLALGKGR